MNYEEAVELATTLHEGQKYGDKPYIYHPTMVANNFEDEDLKIVAILHDTVEDTDLTIKNLSDYGLKEELVEAVKLLTKLEEQTYLDYITLVKENKIATAVKIEDLNHNLSDLKKGNLREKYLMALYILSEVDEVERMKEKVQEIVKKVQEIIWYPIETIEIMWNRRACTYAECTLGEFIFQIEECMEREKIDNTAVRELIKSWIDKREIDMDEVRKLKEEWMEE